MSSKVHQPHSAFQAQALESPCVLESTSARGSCECDVYDKLDDSDGALQPGGAYSLFSKESTGLLCQYAAVGILSGMLPSLAYPIFTTYLRMEGYQIASYVPLINLAWSLKVFAGIASDCFPIYGYKRKSYVIIGWALCFVCCAVMALTPFPAPRYANALKGKVLTNLTDEDKKLYVNLNSAVEGHQFVLWSMGATMGFVMAIVAADAVMVEHAQREPLHMRGRIQTMIYVIRELFRIIPNVIIGVGLSDFQYGGTFDFSIAPNTIYWILTATSALAIAASVFLLVEKPSPAVPFRQYMHGLWDLLQLRVMWQICAFRALNFMALQFDATPRPIVAREWVNVTPLFQAVYTIGGVTLNMLTYFFCGRYGLGWNWHTAIIIATVVAVVLDASVMFPAIWGASFARSEHVYLTVYLVNHIPKAVQFIVAAYSTVELADMGNEGAVHGLITTIANVAWPVSAVLYKSINAAFDTTSATMKKDTSFARWEVTYCFIIAFAVKIGSLGFLVLLPKQKAHLQLLKRRGRRDWTAGILTIVIFTVMLIYQFVTNAMSLFPTTYCWRIAGGPGIPRGQTECPVKKA
ncbi:hypothetical protein H310_05391 [Aphanomyces invadans]|uniref:Transmembrane protein n=1 Tax=Aphanomyces invadans TaxID=157072 RepID=A0A024U969_9STRA|nr:hypothetical protein H310_05391 [Aphanomyces invadans]ETW02946.1 hypothetical protein H310_05391 [Aphanomyces invadans]RHY28344.1 hypothetical protein DYB32_006041 [Aphanomyces invadans]|eukprot:XP_008868330.1 hypothetical protein H310_05391 [Aphanomyces invadans]